MKSIKCPKFFKNIENVLDKHGSEICTGLAIVGTVTTAILAVKQTPKAVILIEEEKAYQEVDELELIDTVKICWKCYIPVAISAGLTIASIAGVNLINKHRQAVLMTACTISESALSVYKNKVVETLGEKEAERVKKAVVKDKINTVENKSEIIVAGPKGDILFCDPMSGRIFPSTVNNVEKIVNELNDMMIKNLSYASLNDFYDKLGLDTTSVGSSVGWRFDTGLIDISLIAEKTSWGDPCLAIYFNNEPTVNFDAWL